MAHVRLLRFLPLALAVQLRLRIGPAPVRVVRPLSTVEIHIGLPGLNPLPSGGDAWVSVTDNPVSPDCSCGLGWKLLAEAKLSIRVPSTLKCSLHSPVVKASSTTASKKARVRPPSCRRGRGGAVVVGTGRVCHLPK